MSRAFFGFAVKNDLPTHMDIAYKIVTQIKWVRILFQTQLRYGLIVTNNQETIPYHNSAERQVY